MLESFLRNLLRFRFLIICGLLFSVLFFGYYITKIQVDNDTVKAIPPKLQAKIDYDNLKKEYPAPYNILFLAEFSSGTLSEKIDSLHSWTSTFKQITGIAGVSDLNSVQIPVRGGFFGITSDYLVSKKLTLEEEQIRKRINENKEFSSMFISDDESVVGMVIGIQNGADRSVIMDNILWHLERINTNPQITTYVTSEGAVSYFIDKAMKHDFNILLPICFLLVFLLLYRIFRKVHYVMAALMVDILALIWTFGLMGILKIPFSVVTSIIPVILFPIGVADAIHLLKLYRHNKVLHHGNILNALKSTYSELITPCFLTSLTTFAGFASFSLSEISWTRTFGIFTGIAVVFAFFFNVILLPLFLSFEKPKVKNEYKEIYEEKLLSWFWNIFAKFSIESNKWVIIIPVLIAVFITGFKSVHVESNSITMLPQDNMLRKSDNFIAGHFGGTRFFSIVLKCNDEKLDSKQKWDQIEKISSYIENMDGIGNVSSMMPLMHKLSGMLSGERLSDPAISMVTATKGFFGKNYMEYLKNFLSQDRKSTRLQITCSNDPEIKPLQIAQRIDSYIKENYQGWEALISGPAILNESMSSVLIKTQISSLISTFIPVFLCLVIFFRSIKVGFFSIIPIVFSTGFIYALMGIMGVTINLVTVIIMNTCIGIGIDYAIHFVSGYIHSRKLAKNRHDAIKRTIHDKGTPILFNAFVVGTGFLVLAFSGFPPIKDFGILVFVSMFASAGFSLLFLSILISLFGFGKTIERRDIV